MDKTELAKQFSLRLREAMLAAKLYSSRSTSGVSIHKLVEITGYSLQICRRYLSGNAIPEAPKLMDMAEKLQVSPGWLLFGDAMQDRSVLSNNVLISKNLLQYIFSYAAGLYRDSAYSEDVSEFLLKLIEDISQIKTSNEEHAKQIIDLALSSIQHFNRKK